MHLQRSWPLPAWTARREIQTTLWSICCLSATGNWRATLDRSVLGALSSFQRLPCFCCATLTLQVLGVRELCVRMRVSPLRGVLQRGIWICHKSCSAYVLRCSMWDGDWPLQLCAIALQRTRGLFFCSWQHELRFWEIIPCLPWSSGCPWNVRPWMQY